MWHMTNLNGFEFFIGYELGASLLNFETVYGWVSVFLPMKLLSPYFLYSQGDNKLGLQARHCGPVGLCTCIIPGGKWFKSRQELLSFWTRQLKNGRLKNGRLKNGRLEKRRTREAIQDKAKRRRALPQGQKLDP